MIYTEKQKRQIRAGFYARFKQPMNDENFKAYTDDQLNELLVLGLKPQSLLHRLNYSMEKFYIGLIVGGIFIYTITSYVWR